MALFRSSSVLETGPILFGDGIYLRAPQSSDFAAWASIRQESRAFLTPWEPSWPRDDLTRSAFKRRLRRYNRDMREDQAYPFFVFRANDNALLGGLTLSNVRRGVAQTCSLGYWIGAPHARKGIMSKAVNTVFPFVFEALRLHRLEAACLPINSASIALLDRCGFQKEGYAREYLCINGVWQDHILFARLREDPAGGQL